MSEILSSVEVDTFDGAPVNLLEQRKGADISGSTVAAQWFIIGRGQSSCPPHNPPKYRPEKDPKVTKNIFSLILLVHSSFVSRGKKLGKVFTMSTLLLELLSQLWYFSLSVLASRARKIYHICMTFSGMLLLALKDSDLLVKETVPQGKKVPKNYFLLLKR